MTGIDTNSVNALIVNGTAYDLNQGLKPEVVEILTQLLEDAKLSAGKYKKPDISEIYNIHDFEKVGEKFVNGDAWTYFKTGSCDEITLRENVNAFKRIYLKPRVLRDVAAVDLSTTILDKKTSAPFYITAFFGSWLADSNKDQAEKPLIRQAADNDMIYMVPSKSTFTFEELLAEAKPDQRLWLQIYTGEGTENSLKLIKQAEEAKNVEALFFTVDMAQIGRRETALRHQKNSSFDARQSTRASLDWDGMLKWRTLTTLKIFLKGIQTVEDAIKAAELGFDGILISNHGGRQVDTARSGIEILAEVVPALKRRGLYDRLTILVDGGVRRGSDVVKAIALGANGVGLGRPFLYPLVTYGDEGVARAIDILKNDVSLNMRLLGVSNVDDLNESYLETTDLFRNRTH